MGQQEVRLLLDRLPGHGCGRVHRQQNLADLRRWVPECQAHGIPRLGEPRREPFVKNRHQLSQSHVGPAGLEPTTFPV